MSLSSKKKEKWAAGANLCPARNQANYTAPKLMKGRGRKFSSIFWGKLEWKERRMYVKTSVEVSDVNLGGQHLSFVVYV